MTRKFQITPNKNYLVYNSFKFYKSIKLGNGHTLWKCTFTGCKSELKTNSLDTRIVQNDIEHNHTQSIRSSKLNSTPISSGCKSAVDRPSISPITRPVDANLPSSPPTTPCLPPVVTTESARVEALILENESLRRQLIQLRKEWEAVVQHSIDVDTKLLLLSERQFVDAATQSDLDVPTVDTVADIQTNSRAVETQTDTANTTREVHVQTDLLLQEVCSFSSNPKSNTLDVELCSGTSISDDVRVNRLLTDDEIMQGITHLNSDEVVVLPPAVCLNVRLSDNVHGQVPPICNSKNIIVAPISNANVDLKYGFNTPGTHWSLVIVNRVKAEYYHLDSIPNLNDTVAREFCKKINTILNFSPFVYKAKKCTRQKDSFSCGQHLINNAILQVKRLLKENKIYNIDDSTSSVNIIDTSDEKHTHKPKVLLIGDSHARNLAGYLQPLMPHCEVIGYCYSGAPMLFVLQKLDSLIRSLQLTDSVVILGGSNNTSSSHLSKVLSKITSMFTSQTIKANIILTEVPHILVSSHKKRKEIVQCNNKLYYLSRKLRIPFVIFGLYLNRSHYTANGQHFNNLGKQVICKVLCEKLNYLLKSCKVNSNANFLDNVNHKP